MPTILCPLSTAFPVAALLPQRPEFGTVGGRQGPLSVRLSTLQARYSIAARIRAG
jgi:hypothetical protein